MSAISPARLIEQARRLASLNPGDPQPSETDLRRAVSAGYYALFHAVALRAARHALPRSPDEAVQRLARSVGHSAIRDVSSWLSGRGAPPQHLKVLFREAADERLPLRLASDLLDAQERRHEADYDHLAEFSRANVEVLLVSIELRLANLELMGDRAAFDVFYAAILLRSQAR